jgi:hypothetical protein
VIEERNRMDEKIAEFTRKLDRAGSGYSSTPATPSKSTATIGLFGVRLNETGLKWPSFATIIADQVKVSEQKRLALEARIDGSNTENLWEQTGVEVIGPGFTKPIDTDDRAVLRRALTEHHVLVMRDQHFTPEHFKATAQLFGEWG